jgi:prolyl-tRNA synthetase
LDLIGLPYQVIVGPKGLAEGNVEVKTRASGVKETMPIGEAIARLSA